MELLGRLDRCGALLLRSLLIVIIGGAEDSSLSKALLELLALDRDLFHREQPVRVLRLPKNSR